MVKIILIIVAVYLLICLILYIVQEKFLFHPEKLKEDFEFQYEVPFEELNFDVKEGVRINGLRFMVENPLGYVFYLKGNSRSVKGWAKFAKNFTDRGYELIMVDYRGFGKSTGQRSERAIASDLQKIYNKYVKEVPEEKVVIYGRSMGTGFASKLASQNSPKMLILNAPYYSMMDTAKRYLFFIPLIAVLRFKIKTYIWLRYVHCPIYILHGTKDRLIPLGSAVRLSKVNPKLTTFYPLPGAGHHNMTEFPEFHQALNEIL